MKKRRTLVISPVGAPIAPTNDETATLSIGTGTKELNLYKKKLKSSYVLTISLTFFFISVFLK